MSVGLTNRATRALHWRLGGAIVDAIAQFGTSVVLGRILLPSDFGVMALAFIVLGLVRPFSGLGMAQALIQRRDLTTRHIRTAFTFSLFFGAAVAGAMALIAPFGALVTKQALVAPVLRWLSLGFVIQGTSLVADALMQRGLDFRRRFFINTGSYVIGYGGLAIMLALNGYGVWSLVFGALAQSLLSSTAALVSARHPMAPLVGRRELAELLNFGFGASMSACVNFLARNADNFVVGRWMGPASLGLYNRAYSLMNLPFTYAATALTSVLFPALSEVQHEPTRMRRAYRLLTRLIAVIAAPAMATLGIAAPHLIVALFGPKWTGAVVPLEVFCIAGYFRALYHISGIVAQSAGRVYGELRNQIGYAVLVVVAALVGTPFGLLGVSVGVSLAIVYMYIATGALALSATMMTWRDYLSVQLPGLAVGVITCVVTLAVRMFLDARLASNGPVMLAVLAAGAIPGSLGILWTLSEPEFASIVGNLPRGFARLSERISRLRGIALAAPDPASRVDE